MIFSINNRDKIIKMITIINNMMKDKIDGDIIE